MNALHRLALRLGLHPRPEKPGAWKTHANLFGAGFLIAWCQVGTAQAEPCAIQSPAASIEQVHIRPPGEAPFVIRLQGVRVTATPSGDENAILDVQGPLRFTTEHPANQLGVALGKRVSLYDGRLRLARGMTARFVLGDEHDPERSDALMSVPLVDLAPAKPIAIPCDALTVPNKIPRELATPDLNVAEGRVLHATSSAPFPLYTRRNATKPWMISFRGPLKVLARSGAWIQVEARWSDGSILRGWSNSDKLVVADSVPLAELRAKGGFAMGVCGMSSHRIRPVSYVLKPNTPIHNRAQGAIWAHTTGTIKVEGFAIARSDGWLQVTSVPGFPSPSCSTHDKFWVHADHIQWTRTPL